MSQSIIASHRLRSGRFSQPGRTYLLTTTVQRREPLFRAFALGRLVAAELRAAHEQGRVCSLAWVVMPDHLHWLVTLEGHSLDAVMRQIKSNSARRINRQLGRAGALWQDGYHDRALRKDADLQAAARYIVANPLRAGLVERVGDYPLWDAIWL
ncbi:REP-associated tyrosine transposase [Pseudomonas sp. UBA2684]|uniref:REP-associated tyrosine transposase n=1 Tax=Pseudomonas sp. UBA2684 TaxID=1947311 RepID=UPI000E83FA67|nr:transposase [Pseudomonas sp. UBA2684]HBX56836.1 transposase [Pseudomonas sp.]|tara:strand:- start:230 stop:691 length:462 start_codon:yes stop_codon:yes gene_type:complete